MPLQLVVDALAFGLPLVSDAAVTPAGDGGGVNVDGNVLTAMLVGLSALVTAVGGVLVQLVRTNPENVKALKGRVEAAEKRATEAEEEVDHLRGQLLQAHAELFSLKAWATSKGWRDPSLTGTPDPVIIPGPTPTPDPSPEVVSP